MRQNLAEAMPFAMLLGLQLPETRIRRPDGKDVALVTQTQLVL
ncbi:hypothetical protein [Sandaracinobacteroides hominis]|nr:hypothetical protein [Sandaracinobacteroides hominis]